MTLSSLLAKKVTGLRLLQWRWLLLHNKIVECSAHRNNLLFLKYATGSSPVRSKRPAPVLNSVWSAEWEKTRESWKECRGQFHVQCRERFALHGETWCMQTSNIVRVDTRLSGACCKWGKKHSHATPKVRKCSVEKSAQNLGWMVCPSDTYRIYIIDTSLANWWQF